MGFLIGILPGAAHIISTFVSYAMEKRLSRHPEEFGTGRIEGVAGPEAANNAATGGAMIPFLALGIPSSPATATMMVALLIHGVKPGPVLMEQHPEVFWGLIASMYIGNVMLLILNLPLVGLFINLLRVPQHFLFPGILLVCFVGVYSVNLSVTDLWIMGIAGVAGYLLAKGGLRHGAHRAGDGAGAYDGAGPPAGAHDVQGRVRDFPEPSHLGGDACGRPSCSWSFTWCRP